MNKIGGLSLTLCCILIPPLYGHEQAEVIDTVGTVQQEEVVVTAGGGIPELPDDDGPFTVIRVDPRDADIGDHRRAANPGVAEARIVGSGESDPDLGDLQGNDTSCRLDVSGKRSG